VRRVGPEVDQEQARARLGDLAQPPQDGLVVSGGEQVRDVGHEHDVVTRREGIAHRVGADDVDPLRHRAGRDPRAGHREHRIERHFCAHIDDDEATSLIEILGRLRTAAP
jgi:hypothetical protein